jgi:hypothetical protein
VKKIAYFLCLMGLSIAAFPQGEGMVVGFADSVRIELENTRMMEAQVIGAGFTTAWQNLGLDHQALIRRQVYAMKKKRYKLSSQMVYYFGAIANAVNTDGADVVKLDGFLRVADKVLDKLRPDKATSFFRASREFFEHHALYFDNTFRLYARDDDYAFEYIEFVPPPVDTTYTEPTQEETDSWNDYDTVQQEIKPYWETLPPPPAIEGPAIRFNRVTLNWVTRYDSVFLRNTAGVFSLSDYNFVGENGSFDWTPAGLNPDSVYCNFTQYSFSAKRPELKADLVRLTYIGKTPGFIPGKFEFKSQQRADSILSTYPRFTSYESNLDIKGLGPETLVYRGGFSLVGPRIMSRNVNNDLARIELQDESGKRFSARSREFVFQDSSVLSNQTTFAIYQGNDSIAHRQVRLKYDYAKDQVVLQSEKGSMRNTPYVSSYFNVDFSANLIRWDLKKDSINFLTQGGRTTVPMIVESVDYYDPEDFKVLEGVGFNFHPLVMVANYCIINNTRSIHSGDLAQYYGFSILDIQKAIEFLAIKGMVEYWPNGDLIIVKEKAITMYQGYKKQSDYDNMKIHSVIGSAPNASLNLKQGEMVIRGVEEFQVSDSLNVLIEPDSAIITLLRNRDIKFNGTITAGNFEITGKDFTLKYDSFFIDMQHIDSINFYAMEKNARGQMVRKKINNSMVGSDSTTSAAAGMSTAAQKAGTLYINRPGNKSGLKKIPNYPRLDAEAGGVIYFDRPEVLGGVYDRSVFFVVPPFKLDSLNDADPTAINFDGTFVSNGMFPSFKEKLHTMPDKSLGFTHITPREGYALYKGDGNLRGEIRLDNRGIRSTGTISYFAATVFSPDFIFYPDSVIARGSRVKIQEKQFGSVKFPQASFGNYQMKWNPKLDQMRLKNIGEPFNFYDSTAQLTGIVTITKNGVVGAGKLDTRGTEIRSRDMSFSSQDFGARHARFKAQSGDPNKPLIDGTDVRVRFNLQENYANISPEIEGVAAIDFPFAQFKTSIPNARWDLNTQKIKMSKNPDDPIESSYFYTTRKELDSLSFYAEAAEYDLNKQELQVSGIPYIVVADAKITPDKGQVLILENARIGTLKNTTIILDTLNGYHRLTEGVVDIVSRKEFSGYATYQYVNLLRDTFAIKMTDFHLEAIAEEEPTRKSNRRKSLASMQTVATGSVTDADRMVLGAGMFYKGNLVMYATKPALTLDGYIKLDIKKLKNYNAWIQYKQSGDETEVLIPFETAVSEEGKKVDAGLHFTAAENNLYISFLNEKNEEDEDFFVPAGTLHYDTASREYRIEDLEKAAGTKLSGKVFSYNDENSQIRFEGPINLLNGTKDFNVTATALGQGNIETNDIQMNTLVLISTTAAAGAFDIMARDIQLVIQNEGAEEGLGDQTELLYKIADIVGERVARDFESRSTQGYVSLGTLAPLARSLTFANVNFKWSKNHHAFYSEGSLGLSNIGKNDINGAFEGFMEVKKNEDGGPVFNIFFKASPDSWYYISYEDNRLLLYSSNADFNTIVSKKTNSGKAKVGEMVFIPGSEEETLAFVNRFRKEYYGIEVPYSLSDGTASNKKKEEKKEEGDGF